MNNRLKSESGLEDMLKRSKIGPTYRDDFMAHLPRTPDSWWIDVLTWQKMSRF